MTTMQRLIQLVWEDSYKSLPVSTILVELGIDKKQLRAAIATARRLGHDIFLGGKRNGAVIDDICFLDGLHNARARCHDCGTEMFIWETCELCVGDDSIDPDRDILETALTSA